MSPVALPGACEVLLYHADVGVVQQAHVRQLLYSPAIRFLFPRQRNASHTMGKHMMRAFMGVKEQSCLRRQPAENVRVVDDDRKPVRRISRHCYVRGGCISDRAYRQATEIDAAIKRDLAHGKAGCQENQQGNDALYKPGHRASCASASLSPGTFASKGNTGAFVNYYGYAVHVFCARSTGVKLLSMGIGNAGGFEAGLTKKAGIAAGQKPSKGIE